MNFLGQGEFKIQESWNRKLDSRQSKSRGKSREKGKDKESNRSLVNAGKNIAEMPVPDILDDQVNRYILREFQAEIPPSIKSQKKIASKQVGGVFPPRQRLNLPNSENELLTSMASRLRTVQTTNKSLREQLRQKSLLIEKMRGENGFLKGFREDSGKAYERMKEVEDENKGLREKVQHMEEYLKKYGLRWVGNKIEGKLEQDKIKQAIKKGNYQYRMPSEIDINTIIRRVEELNGGLHSEGMGTEVYSQNGIHKFRKAEPLPMGFYANGIAIKGYKFFSYQTKQSLQILGDLIDGYFPYVLKLKYPNGVFLKVCDKLSQRYSEQSTEEKIVTFQSKADKDFRPPSKEQFLNKLPKSVMKNGKVISIRGEIEKRLNGESNNIIKQEQEQNENEWFQRVNGEAVFKTAVHAKVLSRQVNEEQVCTLKIRNQSGQIFILQLQPSHCMSEVYSWMRRVVRVSSFQVMGNYPRRVYSQSQVSSLQLLGLCPNALLHIQSLASV